MLLDCSFCLSSQQFLLGNTASVHSVNFECLHEWFHPFSPFQERDASSAPVREAMVSECQKALFNTTQKPNWWFMKKKDLKKRKEKHKEKLCQWGSRSWNTKRNDETQIFTHTCMALCLQTKQTSLETSVSLSLKHKPYVIEVIVFCSVMRHTAALGSRCNLWRASLMPSL